MEFLHECDLIQIEDILPFFSDFVTIDHFKEAICNSLKVSTIVVLITYFLYLHQFFFHNFITQIYSGKVWFSLLNIVNIKTIQKNGQHFLLLDTYKFGGDILKTVQSDEQLIVESKLSLIFESVEKL